MSVSPTLAILRRESGGVGGAEKAAARMRRMFGENHAVSLHSAGCGIDAGLRGPGWFKALSFARGADRAMAKLRPDLIFSMERGPRCDIYRAGDGVHRRWLEIAYAGKPSRWLNPLHHVYPALERRTLESARAIIANSEMVARDLRRFYPQLAAKVRVIRNGVDLARFSPCADAAARDRLRADLGYPASAPVFLFVGSGWERKGLARSLHVIGALADVMPDARLVVLGKGRPEAFSSLLVATGMTEKIRFLGSVDSVADHLRAADFFILPTRYDPCSNACIEALAAGLPVITTDTNGASEFVRDGVTGLILSEADPSADAARLRAALAHGFAPRVDIAVSVAHAGLDAETAAYDGLFREILIAKRAGGSDKPQSPINTCKS